MLVIADFDNYFYMIRRSDSSTKIIHDPNYSRVFTWETTSSQDAAAKIPENELNPENVLILEEVHLRPKYIYLKWTERSCRDKCLYVIYRFLQIFYTSFYYYFMPYVATFLVWNLLSQTNSDVAVQKQ